MRQRAINLLERINRQLKSAKKHKQSKIMNEDELREQEQAELRELALAAIEQKRSRRAHDNRTSANTT